MSTVYNLKREVEKPARLTGGHRLCAGCGAGIVVSGVLRALDQEDRAVVVNATSCLEVSNRWEHARERNRSNWWLDCCMP